jgi:hypothetical protein
LLTLLIADSIVLDDVGVIVVVFWSDERSLSGFRLMLIADFMCAPT